MKIFLKFTLTFGAKIVLIVSSTASIGTGDLNYDGRCTTHSMFKIPIKNLDSCPSCNICNRSRRAEFIQNADFIIWDPDAMTHIFTVETLGDALNDLTGNKLPSGNENINFVGFRQIPQSCRYLRLEDGHCTKEYKIFRKEILEILYSSYRHRYMYRFEKKKEGGGSYS